METLGLFVNPWPGGIESKKRSKNPTWLYRYAVWFKANPRSEQYMLELFGERYPDGHFLTLREPGWTDMVAQADEVVLIYPDSTGLYCDRVEREVLRRKKPEAALRILNGRRRLFLLRPQVLRELKLRRFLERTMLLEFACNVLFLAATPFLALYDWFRGRR